MNEVAKFQTVSETVLSTSGNAPDLFVINLCAAMTPMPSVPRNLKGFEKYKLYQVSRQEDGRRRFRLRLGFFTNEADAEWVLNSVRNLYPTAFTSCVTQEDLRFCDDPTMTTGAMAARQVPAPAAVPAAAPAPASSIVPVPVSPPTAKIASAAPTAVPSSAAALGAVVTPPPAVEAPKLKPAAQQAATAKIVTKPATPPAPAPKQLTAETPAVVAAKSVSGVSQPFHVARGIELPETSLELTDEHPVLPTPTATPATKTASARPTAPAAKPAAPAAGPVLSATLVNPPKVVDDYVPILDTTLTIRTLTSTEAEDPNRPKWFAVQLALSEQPINLDTMPKLDIFAAYTLYSVAVMEGGTIRHALRLGFFRENVSAEAVMGYLKAFFNAPAITQIASAEYDRFAERKPKPQATAAPAGQPKVVSIDDKRPTAPVTPVAAVVTKSGAKPAAKPKDAKARAVQPPRPQSFLSRLIGRQLD